MHRFTKSERAYWLENDQSGERMRIGSLIHYSVVEQFVGNNLGSVLAGYERLRAERDAALRDIAAKMKDMDHCDALNAKLNKEVEALRAQLDARRERDALAAQRTSVTAQVRAVDEEPKATPVFVKADAWPLLHGVFGLLQEAENSTRKGNTTSALLRVISAVRELAAVAPVNGGGK